MRAIGVRVEAAKVIHWAVVDGTCEQPILIDHGRSRVPKVNDEASEVCAWAFNAIQDLVSAQEVQAAGLRLPETTGRGGKKLYPRIRVEGAILAALGRSGIEVISGPLKTITARLDTQSAKSYLSRDDFRGIDIKQLSVPIREALLVATAALP